MLRESGVAWELRTTLLPSLSLADYDRMAQEIAPPPRYVCNRYRDPKQPHSQPVLHSPGYDIAVQQILERYMPGTEVVI